MEVRVDKRSNRIVAFCSGRMDALGAPVVEKTLVPLLESMSAESFTPMVLDFSDVSYLASAGIRTLLILARTARRSVPVAPEDLPLIRLVNLKPAVKYVLNTAGLGEDVVSWAAAEKKTAAVATDYRKALEVLRHGFPAPVSDPVTDAYFVQTISRALNYLDDMKTERTFLGERVPLDYERARAAKFPEPISGVEKTVQEIVKYLEGMTVWGHPRTQVNVIPPSSILSIVGQLLAAIYSPNIIWDEISHRLGEAEVEVTSMCADLIGYDPATARGIFTFGGTGTILYGLKLGIEKADPGAFANGVKQDLLLICSDASHYAKYSVLGWLGLGTKKLVTVSTDADNSMDLADLDATMRKLIESGRKIACITATMGTTDAFGIDNLEYVVRLRDRLVKEYHLPYSPHVHADAVIGWAWAVFNDYDFNANPLGFPPRTLRSLWDAHVNIRSLGMADSVGIDFHKTGFAPYISSLFLCKNMADLNLITRDTALMPYLFQYGKYHPGVFTLEASRPGGSVLAALANLKFLGKQGFRVLLGHIVTMAELLRERLEKSSFACLVNDYNYGPVTLFRVYPEGVDPHAAYRREVASPEEKESLLMHNEYNRRIFKVLQKQMESGGGLALSETERYRISASGAPILALKSFVMSPFVEESAMDKLMSCLEEARKEVTPPRSAG